MSIDDSAVFDDCPFIHWLHEQQCVSPTGRIIYCYFLDWDRSKDDILAKWAVHIRRQYINDQKLDERIQDRKETKFHYLSKHVIPASPQIRAGDFGEFIVEDILEYILSYSVPRYKQCGRRFPDKSDFGVDVIGYKYYSNTSRNNELDTIEVKSSASKSDKKSFISRLNDADQDLRKDPNRLPGTLSYMLDEASDAHDSDTITALRYFFNKGDHEFKVRNGSGVTTSFGGASQVLSLGLAGRIDDVQQHPLIVIYAHKFMELIEDLYKRCASEK